MHVCACVCACVRVIVLCQAVCRLAQGCAQAVAAWAANIWPAATRVPVYVHVGIGGGPARLRSFLSTPAAARELLLLMLPSLCVQGPHTLQCVQGPHTLQCMQGPHTLRSSRDLTHSSASRDLTHTLQCIHGPHSHIPVHAGTSHTPAHPGTSHTPVHPGTSLTHSSASRDLTHTLQCMQGPHTLQCMQGPHSHTPFVRVWACGCMCVCMHAATASAMSCSCRPSRASIPTDAQGACLTRVETQGARGASRKGWTQSAHAEAPAHARGRTRVLAAAVGLSVLQGLWVCTCSIPRRAGICSCAALLALSSQHVLWNQKQCCRSACAAITKCPERGVAGSTSTFLCIRPSFAKEITSSLCTQRALKVIACIL